MSHSQSRAERTEYKKTGRSGSYQQRSFSGAVGGKGGGGTGATAPSLSSNQSRSFKKNNNYNAQGGQHRASGASVNSDANNQITPGAVRNGAHVQQQSPGVSDAQVTSAPVKPSDASAPKTTLAVPKAPTSNVTMPSPETNTPATPAKGDASRSFPLQFGSLSPGCMNGMQIPARTSSAPPNIDEQKRDQARHQTSRAAAPLPTPSIPKQLPKKDGGTTDRSNTGEAHSKPKRDSQTSAVPPGTQNQKPSVHSTPGMPMQMSFNQPQVPLQFGAPNPPQIQPQAVSATSVPMGMQMPLPIGNSPLQPPVFISGLQPHQMQSQGLMHQGQGLNFKSPMGPQMPPQLGNMGINMSPQFPQQQAGKLGGPRKVKITHPDTHEELRFDGSSGPRSYPNMPPQSQAVLPFQHPHRINYYPNSYTSSSILVRPPNFLPVNGSQINPNTQPPKSYNQVMVKSAGGSHGEKGALSLTSFPALGSKVSKPQVEHSVHPQKNLESQSQSSLQQWKPGRAASSTLATVGSKQSAVHASVSVDIPDSCSSSSPSIVSIEDLSGERHQQIGETEPVKDESQSVDSDYSITQDQVGRGSAASSNLSLKSSDVKTLDAKMTDSTLTGEVPGHGEKPSPATRTSSSDAHGSKSDHDLEGEMCKQSKGSGVLVAGTKQSESEVLPEAHDGLTLPESSLLGSKSLTSAESISVESSTGTYQTEDMSLKGAINEGQSEESVGGYVENEKGLDNTSIARSSTSNQDSASVRVPSPSGDNVKIGEEVSQGKSSDFILQSLSVNEKSVLDPNVAKSSVPSGRKRRKELCKKADAAAATSDLYLAYKGPEEKKEAPTSVKSTVNISSNSLKENSPSVIPEDVVPSQKDGQSKVEPDDWEDAADLSTPKLESVENEKQVTGGFYNHHNDDGLRAKKYSRDFLLKFAEQCIHLPEGFEFTSDISEALTVSNIYVSRDSYPNTGRVIDRPIGGPRPDRRGTGIGDEDKWSKLPGPLVSGRDVRVDIGPGGQIISFRPGQGGNFGLLRNARAQISVQYPGAILTGPMQSFGPLVGIQRNNSDSDRWARGTAFQKGLMISPQSPSQMMHRAENKYQIGKVTDEEQAKQRQLKAILNKLTPQNFEKLFEQVKQVNIDNAVTLTGVISQIFDKALMEPTFCEMYANFCYHLAAELPDLSVDNERITFKRLLLNKCQEEFERGEREEEEANKADEEGEVKQSEEEREEKRLRARRRMLGNIRLIGELYKKKMLTERIMHECIKKLLWGTGQVPDEEDIEALCKLMSTIGEMIDHPKAKEHMDAYFDMMAKLSTNTKLSSRVRFLLLDAIDLRKNKWQQRRKVEGPKKIEEVHRDAAQERQAQASRLTRTPMINNSVRRGQPVDYAPRGSNVLSSPSSQIAGVRGVPPQLRGFGAQDVRFEDRHPLDSRIPSVPLPQRSLVDDSITLGPQGGLGRGMSFVAPPTASSGPLTDIPSPGDSRRMATRLNGYGSVTARSAYDPRENIMPRYMLERFASPSVHDQSSLHEQSMNHGNKDMRNADRGSDRTLLTSSPAQGVGSTFSHSVSSEKVWPEERLRDMSMGAIKEFYSAKDENEVVLCIKDLNAPSFYPSMIFLWVTDSFERKDMERDLLVKLLISLSKSRDRMISEDQLIKGFESVLMTLEDAVNDAPRAAEFLGCIFGRFILENVISLAKIGELIFEGGEEQGRLVEIGLAAEVLGSILETIESEKGNSVLADIRTSSNLRLEDFRPTGSNKSLRLDKFISK